MRGGSCGRVVRRFWEVQKALGARVGHPGLFLSIKGTDTSASSSEPVEGRAGGQARWTLPREPNPVVSARYPVPQRGTPSAAAAGRAVALPSPSRQRHAQFPAGNAKREVRRRGEQPPFHHPPPWTRQPPPSTPLSRSGGRSAGSASGCARGRRDPSTPSRSRASPRAQGTGTPRAATPASPPGAAPRGRAAAGSAGR